MSSRLKQLSLLVLMGAILLSGGLIFAQDAASRALTPNVTSEGQLDADNITQVFTVAASSGQSVSVTATTESGATLALVMTDATGASLGQAAASAADEAVALENISIPTSGTYFVTVFNAAGLPVAAIDFTITLEVGSAEATAEAPVEGQVLTATGLEFELSWDTVANLDLEVRDPVGGSLFWETPSVESGGTFSANANGACNALSEAASERATWPSGAVPAGSYEMIVYFQQQEDCPNSNPANLTLTVTLDSEQVSEVTATIQPDQIYLASVVVNTDGTVDTGVNGVKVDPPSITGLNLASPLALTQNTAANGILTAQQPYVVYGFAAQSGDVVSIQMDATSGSLDTQMLLVDPNGNVVASNDDREVGNTNSFISNYSVILAGDYSVIATRYGQALGGTEGDFTLTLTGAVTATVTGTQTADIQVPVFDTVPRGSVEVSLQWNTSADIQLLVRDPQGNAIYDGEPTSPIGGAIASTGNDSCVLAVDGAPLTYIYWPEGRLPTAGPYEIEVLYQSNCNDTTPVQFVLTVVANGQVVLQQNEPLQTDERYVVSYNIGLDGAITAGEGGVFGTKQRPDASSLLTDVVTELPTAPVIANGTPVTGSIRLTNKFDVYTFDGTAGQVATIGLERLNGTLDPVVFLIGPGGDQITQNDDASLETTNSAINNFILPVDGQYTIIATHFGGEYGVTAGDYRLTLRLN
ncbi:MAG: PPC domain-containing protein [Chloroflexi bacterium]|nr:PPC domain-containing protein [Chloroflexota bacterium]MCC6892005.1 PPC domain-containing protein [Anaerolineae bacterium]